LSWWQQGQYLALVDDTVQQDDGSPVHQLGGIASTSPCEGGRYVSFADAELGEEFR
jgi:hypothetical protein